MTTTSRHTRQGQAKHRQGLAISGLKLAVCMFAALAGVAQADEGFQPQDTLLDSARSFLETQLSPSMKQSAEIVLGHLDPRLRLKTCDAELQPFLPTGAKLPGKLNVGIRCPEAWTVYLSAEIRVFAEIIIAARTLSRGATLSAGDTTSQRMEVSNLNSGYYLQSREVEGKILKRSVPAGRPLTPNMLRAPLLVRRGDSVTIIASTAGLQVRMKGKAMEDAALGERVSVQNLRSKRIVEGTAIESGLVQVLM